MKANSLRVTGVLMALSLSLATFISCHQAPVPGPQSGPPVLNSIPDAQLLPIQADLGSIQLNVQLPVPRAYGAYRNYHGFKTADIEEKRINRIRVTIKGTVNDFLAEKTIPISQGGMVATIKVPLGKNYLLTVQGMDDLEAVPGAEVKSVFTVESSEVVPDVDVTPLTTSVARVVEAVQNRDADAAKLIDTDKLLSLIVEGKSAANPFLVNTNAFADAIINNTPSGTVPSIVPADPVLRPGNITGTVTGLEPGDTALVFSNDPVSEPFIIVAPPLLTDETVDERELDFRIDNVPPGEWIVRVVASGYKVEGDTIESLDELSATKTVSVDSNALTSAEFTVQSVNWSSSPFNASGNIGSSDQPDAMVDGSDNIHMVWRQDGFSEQEESGSIFYSRWNGKTWSTDNRFISPPGDNKFRGARQPAIAVGTDRTPHVVWSANSNNTDFRGRRIAFARFDGVSWSEPLVISTTEAQTAVAADHPDIDINPINGQAYAVWSQLSNGVRAVYISQLQNGQWLEPIRLSQESTSSVAPYLTVGTDGWIRVIWSVEDSSRVQYIEWDGKEFSAIEEVPFNQSADGQRDRNMAVSIDRLNRLHVVRRAENTIQYIFRSNNSWSKPEFVHEVAGEALPVLSDASLTLDEVGNVNAAWGSALVDGTPVVRYRRRTAQGWELPSSTNSAGTPTATPTPTAFPTPTPGPTATPLPTPTPNPDGTTTTLGYENLPQSENRLPCDAPQLTVDGRGRLSVMWSNCGSDPVNSDIYHSLKAEPAEETD